jgi:hypothetical protein
MPWELKRAGFAFIFYAAAVVIVGGLYVGLGYLGLLEAGARAALFEGGLTQREPSRIETAVSSAREIKAALARPIAGPEPLGPIRSQPANALGGPHAKLKTVAREHRRKVPTRDADAFSESSMTMPGANEGFDRHRPL